MVSRFPFIRFGKQSIAMSFFLKLRHWELFLALILPTALCWLWRVPFQPLVVASIGLFMLIVLFAWMGSVGLWCNTRLPESRRSNPIAFVGSMLIPLVYVLMYIFAYLPQLAAGGPPDKPPLWLLPMHMLSMVSVFYVFWFTASRYKSLLENEDADFLIFSSTFFLMFIFPLGVWIIQPSVNELYHRLTTAETGEAGE